MDMQSIFPLLLQQRSGSDPRMQTLLKLAGGQQPDLSTVLNMAKSSAPLGLKPLVDLASYAIIGKLAAYFAQGQ